MGVNQTFQVLRFSHVRAQARTTGVCVFCCHKCHKWGGLCVNTITTLERLLKNDSSVDRKRHVVLHKTTRRFFVKKGMEWRGSD